MIEEKVVYGPYNEPKLLRLKAHPERFITLAKGWKLTYFYINPDIFIVETDYEAIRIEEKYRELYDN